MKRSPSSGLSNIGYTRTWRKLHAHVRSRSCAPTCRAQSYQLQGGACKFGGDGFSHVLRRRCLRSVLPCTVDKPGPGASFEQFVRSRGCFPTYRAQSHQGLVWRVQLWRRRFQLRFASTRLAVVLALRGCTSAGLRACVSYRLAQPEHHTNE